MRSAADLKKEIEARLRNYLSRDKNGIRHALLKLFVKAKSLTVAETQKKLNEKFEISYQSIASMVGTIASRLGILRIKKNKDSSTSTYELKDQYKELVISLVDTV